MYLSLPIFPLLNYLLRCNWCPRYRLSGRPGDTSGGAAPTLNRAVPYDVQLSGSNIGGETSTGWA